MITPGPPLVPCWSLHSQWKSSCLIPPQGAYLLMLFWRGDWTGTRVVYDNFGGVKIEFRRAPLRVASFPGIQRIFP